MLRNFCILMSLGKFNLLELNPAAFQSIRRFPLAIVRTELRALLVAESSVSLNSCWVTLRLSIIENKWKL